MRGWLYCWWGGRWMDRLNNLWSGWQMCQVLYSWHRTRSQLIHPFSQLEHMEVVVLQGADVPGSV